MGVNDSITHVCMCNGQCKGMYLFFRGKEERRA